MPEPIPEPLPRAIPAQRLADGLRIDVRLTPRGGRDGIDGAEDLADGVRVLKVRVRAAPEDGEANAALLKLVARRLGVPASAASLVAGPRSRRKVVHVAGDPAALAAALRKMLSPRD